MKIIRGQTVSFDTGVPRHHANGALAVAEDGVIAWCGEASLLPEDYKSAPMEDHGDLLVMPGFIDAHIHFPQYRMLAAPGKDLLDWLRRFTFPEESRYADIDYATAAAEMFLDRLLAHGTTSAMAFCSVHKVCAESLFAAAAKRNMALITGKTMMDRNAIPAVQDTPEAGAAESAELYAKWHGKGRALYAVTPRFAITSSDEQLRLSGELMHSLTGARLQTHLSESPGEIAFVRELFPWSKDYTDVYDRYGLLGPNSHFAHGIHLSERECVRLSETGSTVIHCPTSNTFLGSGLMRFEHLRKPECPVGIGVATDVGGGTSYSMLATLGETYKVQMLAGYKPTAGELFHMATAGNAKRLGLAGKIGTLQPGAFADLIVVDPNATPVLASRHELSQSIEDVLFALAILGDDRAIRATYVAGRKLHEKPPLTP